MSDIREPIEVVIERFCAANKPVSPDGMEIIAYALTLRSILNAIIDDDDYNIQHDEKCSVDLRRAREVMGRQEKTEYIGES